MLLFLSDFFPPGYRAGGPVRSCLNLSVGLGATVPVRVITRDTEWGDTEPYPGIKPDCWLPFAPGVEVCYASVRSQGYKGVVKAIKESGATVFYLNSMFSLPFTIFPLLAHWRGHIQGRVVLAPRGMLKESALQFKPLKKQLFLRLFRWLGWHKRVVFQATSEGEIADIKRVFGAAVEAVFCPQVPEVALLAKRMPKTKSAGKARFCMVGRVHPIKNTALALEMLREQTTGEVVMDIIGPAEDAAYFNECQRIAATLPANITVKFWGEMPPEQAHDILAQSDFFYLLTQGENFGHAIFEALALGKPVIISDQTPWRQLQQHQSGWDLKLQDTAGIAKVVAQAVTMDNQAYQQLSNGAYQQSLEYAETSDWQNAYLRLFFPEAAIS